jgi:hypothetical protein
MTTGDKYLYYGFWGLIVGFAMFYGWRVALPLFVPIAQYVFSLVITDNNFDPILVSVVMNFGLDFIAGLCVAVALCFLIRILLKPTTMLFLIFPVVILLGKSYWWLISSYLDNSFYPNNVQLLMYVAGPLIVAFCFVVSFWFIAIRSLTRRSSKDALTRAA